MLLGFFFLKVLKYIWVKGRTGKNRGVPDVSPEVLLALRWMPRCSALEAAPITEKMNYFISLQA